MTEVTGTKQYRSVVVQERPGRRLVAALSVVAVVVATAMLAYWFGGRSISQSYLELGQKYQETLAQLQVTAAKYQDASQQLANISLGAEVDRAAVEDVRGTVREHKQTIAKLKEEITFYKGLMAPTERERGLGIRSWEVYSTSNPQRFEFKLVMQQLALKHAVLTGTANIVLVGKQWDIETSLSLNTLTEHIEDPLVKLRFKYFQYIEGELELPVGFEPQRVDIIARASKPKTVRIEKHYGWLAQK